MNRSLSDPRFKQEFFAAKPLSPAHWDAVSCKEARCRHHENGWKSLIDESNDFGRMQAGYIRRKSGRHFTEERDETGVTVFTFPAGQKCFREHKQPNDRPGVYEYRTGGGGLPILGRRRFGTAGELQEKWADELHVLKRAQERG